MTILVVKEVRALISLIIVGDEVRRSWLSRRSFKPYRKREKAFTIQVDLPLKRVRNSSSEATNKYFSQKQMPLVQER